MDGELRPQLFCITFYSVSNMKRVNTPNKNGYIEIDFNGHIKAGFKVEGGCIIVLGAMDGYGVPIKIED